MDLERADGPLALAFERELKRHHGRKGKTEIALGYRRGHFSRLLRENKPIQVDLILKALDLLDVDPRDFFAKAYDIALNPEHLLSLHERPGKVDRVLRRIEKAARRLETKDPPEPPRIPPRDFWRRLEAISRSGVAYQRKYLRRTKMFRQPAFLTEYLERLDALRYSKVAKAAKLAETVALDLIPKVPGERSELLGFMCKAVGVYGSAKRQMAEFDTAAAAIGFGLRLAGRHGLKMARAELLRRGAYVLSDNKEFERAEWLLRDSQIGFSDQKEEVEIGKTMIDRAVMLSYRHEHQRSIQLFMDGFEIVPEGDRYAQRWRLSALNGITMGYRILRKLDVAERWLVQAIEDVSDPEGTHWARLSWQRGCISFERDDYEKAEKILRVSYEILHGSESPVSGALVCLDLTTTLLAQGKCEEAHSLAQQSARTLSLFSDNSFAQATFFKFIQASLNRELTTELIEQVSDELRQGAPESEYALVMTRPPSHLALCAAREPPVPDIGHR